MENYVLIVAGGSGTRMGSALPKQFLPLHQKPLLVHSIAAFLRALPGCNIVLVLPAAYLETGTRLLEEWFPEEKTVVTIGGETRFHSVLRGLEQVPHGAICFVHDAVRCLVSATLIRHCHQEALAHGNAIPAIPCSDSLRLEDAGGRSRILDRSLVRLIQTPQTFLSTPLKKAFLQPYSPAFTDEASVLESTGATIHLVPGEVTNIKITTPVDMIVAEQIMGKEG